MASREAPYPMNTSFDILESVQESDTIFHQAIPHPCQRQELIASEQSVCTRPEMSNIVEKIALPLRIFAEATGVELQKEEFNDMDAGLDGVTSDLNI